MNGCTDDFSAALPSCLLETLLTGPFLNVDFQKVWSPLLTGLSTPLPGCARVSQASASLPAFLGSGQLCLSHQDRLSRALPQLSLPCPRWPSGPPVLRPQQVRFAE